MHKKFITLFKKRNVKLKEMQYASYQAYLASEHWRQRRLVHAAIHPPICDHCRETADVLHHVSYDRLGQEADEDLLWLCAAHHQELHDYGEIRLPTEAQLTRLRLWRVSEDVVAKLSRGTACRLIDDIFNGRALVEELVRKAA